MNGLNSVNNASGVKVFQNYGANTISIIRTTDTYGILGVTCFFVDKGVGEWGGVFKSLRIVI